MNYRPRLADHLPSLEANAKVFGLSSRFRELVSQLVAPNTSSDGFDQAHGVETASSVHAHEIGSRHRLMVRLAFPSCARARDPWPARPG